MLIIKGLLTTRSPYLSITVFHVPKNKIIKSESLLCLLENNFIAAACPKVNVMSINLWWDRINGSYHFYLIDRRNILQKMYMRSTGHVTCKDVRKRLNILF